MKLLHRLLLGVVLSAACVVVHAGEMPFSQKLFDDLRAAGKPVVVHVYAVWCGTCKVQSSVLVPLLARPEFSGLTLLKADFDQEKPLLKALNIPDRSTFVAFKGSAEVGRSTADMNKDSIASLLRKAL